MTMFGTGCTRHPPRNPQAFFFAEEKIWIVLAAVAALIYPPPYNLQPTVVENGRGEAP